MISQGESKKELNINVVIRLIEHRKCSRVVSLARGQVGYDQLSSLRVGPESCWILIDFEFPCGATLLTAGHSESADQQ